MKHVIFPESGLGRSLSFYLAAEEVLAARYPDDDLFFMWQVDPTVICGRNQLVQAEVNLDYCREHGIRVNRRKSGGGCVYADRDNIMFSHITSVGGDSVTTVFGDYTARVAAFLRSLGLSGTASERNDVLIDGRKVSGNAFYRKAGRDIVHGTMLFRADPAAMMCAITPSTLKLQSKGVQSVRSRITTVAEHLPNLALETFMRAAADFMTDGELPVTDDDIAAIAEVERHYDDPAWVYGSNPAFDARHRVRLDGVGEFQVSVTVKGGLIRHIDMAGDFFVLADLDAGLLDRLKGAPYTRQGILDALRDTDPGRTVAGLTAGGVAELLLGAD